MIAPSTLPPPVSSHLADFVARSRRLALLRAAGVALALFGGWMLLWCAVDRLIQLPKPARLVLLITGFAAAVWHLSKSLLASRRRPNWIAVACEIERQDPRFSQKLITVTSQAILRAEDRGSDQILWRLGEEVGRQLQERRRTSVRRYDRVAMPWAIVAVIVAGMFVFLNVPEVRFGQLAGRFTRPWANLPPVTTTELTLTPGDTDLIQSQPITIEATVRRQGDSPVTLFLADEGGSWSRVLMTPSGGDVWRFNLASIDRDVRYYVTAGDARSTEHVIRVLRRPAVARFNIRYDYPPYTRLPPAYLTNEDGRIEAPSGTKVLLTVTATEPLSDALLVFADRRLPMQPTSDPATREAEIVVAADRKYSIELVSERDVRGTGPSGSAVRVLPDLPPQVRLARGGDSLHLGPHDIVPISYDALDDFGIQSLALEAQVNSQPTVSRAIPLWGDVRRQQDVYDFDLAKLTLKMGDVVTLTLAATDTGGHVSHSIPLQVLVSPRSVDLDTYQRIVELGRSRELAHSLRVDLQEAADAEEQLSERRDRRASEYLTIQGRGDRALSNAVQTAGLLRQSLLRAITHSSSPLTETLAAWTDTAEVESTAAQEAFRLSGTHAGPDASDIRALKQAADHARLLQAQLSTVEQGERADALMIDRENLRAAQKRRPADEKSKQRLNETVQRMARDIAFDAHAVGLDAGASGLDQRLRDMVAAKQALLAGTKPVEFASVAKQWAQQIRQYPQKRLGLEARLAAAAQAEAIRPDADLVRARDLELASHAASAMASAIRSRSSANLPPVDHLAGDLRVLAGAGRHDRSTLRYQIPPARARRELDAREDLARLAGDSQSDATTRPALVSGRDPQREAEALAMQANAAGAERRYDDALRLEAALMNRLRWRTRRDRGPLARTIPATSDSQPPSLSGRIERHRQASAREMNAAVRLDELDSRQQQINQSTGPEAAAQQRNVAQQITAIEHHGAEVDGNSARERAIAQVLVAQEQLAAIPQVLAESQSLAEAKQESAARAAAARQRSRLAKPDQKQAAERAATEAEQASRIAGERLTHVAHPLSTIAVQSLADGLAAFAPETDAARDMLLSQVLPAVQVWQDAIGQDDVALLDRDASDVRESLAQAQRELASAREVLVKRDPLMAARWFARAAAQSLALQPPDLGTARRHQAGITEFLSRAWDQSIHRAAQERLAVLPSLAGVLGPPSPAEDPADKSQQDPHFAAMREWERLRDQGPQFDASLPDSEPPGYEQSLKLYFEALGKAQEGK